MSGALRRLWSDESGQALTEYSLTTGAVAAMMAFLAYLFREQLADLLDLIGANMVAKTAVVNT